MFDDFSFHDKIYLSLGLAYPFCIFRMSILLPFFSYFSCFWYPKHDTCILCLTIKSTLFTRFCRCAWCTGYNESDPSGSRSSLSLLPSSFPLQLCGIEAVNMTSEFPQVAQTQLSLLLLWLPCWCATAKLRGALHFARNWVHNLRRISHRTRLSTRWRPPREKGWQPVMCSEYGYTWCRSQVEWHSLRRCFKIYEI